MVVNALCVMYEGCGAVAAAQAQQQGNPNIIPLMHSRLAHLMPQMSLPGSAHSVSQPPSMLTPPQTGAYAASMPPGFPSFVMAPSSGGISAMPWPMVSQAPHRYQAAPAAVPAATGAGSVPAPTQEPETAEPAEAQAEGLQAAEAPSSDVLTALLGDNAAQPQDATQQQAV